MGTPFGQLLAHRSLEILFVLSGFMQVDTPSEDRNRLATVGVGVAIEASSFEARLAYADSDFFKILFRKTL
jgi:hypothetical protein